MTDQDHDPDPDTITDDDVIGLVSGRKALPFVMLPVWVALSPVSANALATYTILLAHVNTSRGDGRCWPTRSTIARLAGGARQPRWSDAPLRELSELGAVDMTTTHQGMRKRNVYVVHETPPPGYDGPLRIDDVYRDVRPSVASSPAVLGRTAVDRAVPATDDAPLTSGNRETAGQPVVRENAPRRELVNCSLTSSARSAQKRTTMVRKNAHELEEPQLEETTTTPACEHAPDAPAGTGEAGGGGCPTEQGQALIREAATAAGQTLAVAVVTGLARRVDAAVESGIPLPVLRTHLTANIRGSRSVAAVLGARLADGALPAIPPPPTRPARAPELDTHRETPEERANRVAANREARERAMAAVRSLGQAG